MKPASTPAVQACTRLPGRWLCRGRSAIRTPERTAPILLGLLLVLGPGLAPPAIAQDRAELERTQILGNRELPKVLTIVPWRKPLPGDLAGRPNASLLDEALAPVDRDVFRRHLSYEAQTRTASAAQGQAPTQARRPASP